MKKTAIWVSLAAMVMSAASLSAGKKGSDPTVIKVGSENVPFSEFEYLYKKNNAQLESGMSLDKYIDMFVNYKLKVQAARDAGLDTTTLYRRDMATYSERLAAPYMQDREMTDSLINAAYSHHKKVYDVTQLLVASGVDEASRKRQREIADSLYAVLKSGEDFDKVIERFNADKSQKGGGGKMVFTAGSVPYRFEDQADLTPIGEYSPLFATSYGWHILRVNSRMDNPGEVKVRHILKLTRDKSAEEVAQQKRAIDSISSLLRSGADFKEVAMAETEDPSGQASGGDLPWFGVGRMVPEFEAASFALADGQISEPVETAYGYHLILKEGSRPVAPLSEMTNRINDLIDHDYRKGLTMQRAMDKYAAANGLKIDNKLMDKAKSIVATDGINEEVRGRLAKMKGKLMSIGKRSVTMSDLVRLLPASVEGDATGDLQKAIDETRSNLLREDMMATLPDREPQYRNLYNEYSDGLLMFEVSNRQVWERSNKDLEGLEKYYRDHCNEYKWDKPHYIGYVISAVNDSVASAALDYLNSIEADDASLSVELRKKFSNNAKVEKVNAGRGDYPIIDYVAFGGQLPESDKRWKAYRAFRGHVAEQPASASDVKGRVSVDYQKQLEADWMKSLRETYPVSVDRDYLRKMLE